MHGQEMQGDRRVVWLLLLRPRLLLLRLLLWLLFGIPTNYHTR